VRPDDRASDSAVGVAPRPAVPAPPPRRHPGRDEGSKDELKVGVALVVITAVGGLYFAFRPASSAVDGWLLDLVGSSRSRWFIDATWLRYPSVIVVGAVIACGVCIWRDRPRALACLIGPPLALLACELAAKPLVGRTLGGALCYPSGSAVGAAALATAAVLAVPVRARVWAVTVASAYALWVAVAVVALQWHYPTDALAGLAFGVGVVLVVDGAAWQAFRHVERRWGPGRTPVGGPSPGGTRAPPR
jgi:membrane-associated phospholipid phosphatase